MGSCGRESDPLSRNADVGPLLPSERGPAKASLPGPEDSSSGVCRTKDLRDTHPEVKGEGPTSHPEFTKWSRYTPVVRLDGDPILCPTGVVDRIEVLEGTSFHRS